MFQSVRAWTADSLERHAVRLETTELASTDRVRADDFLLRSALAALVERAEHDLTGHRGGLIRLSAHIEAGKAYIQVADNNTRVRRVRRISISTASAQADAPSYIDALAASMPVRRQR